jgi:hypothetical protein
MPKVLFLGAVIAAFLTSGCAVTDDPVKIGKDTYTSAGSWGWSSSSSLRSDLYREASAFCASQGKAMDALQGTGHDSGYAKWASAEVTFRCLDTEDPEYARKQMQFQPNVRIQVID